MTQAWPSDIRLSQDKKTLAVSFDTGEKYEFSAEFLRVTSPSAEVQGHNADEKKTIGGKRNVEIMNIEPVGNYAVRLSFTDLHDTGYYTWDYFLQSGKAKDEIWQTYLSELSAKGLNRG
ncbi:gamma-butyrobetaine hydroxylase-like domain-containing protein [Cohaesibacter celericrescens]|uniref:Gamma-butyrobetaine hydroxylase-like N-terminal domain-containing protein n=1 Tax=Cohaesibacter celericrescens TaxID=2067669 RepID=A0A2N5XQH1_9HYPH|nr:DUF971 domain-containing protein [Cohaesibacter celericrescens]PLW76769.1 hypothetical protein C0081_11930 [Cohaesibacter celericrescens]